MAPTSVVVSRYFVDSISIVLHSSRPLGLMPFIYHKSELRFEFSKWLAAYGVFTVVFLSCATLAGFILDLEYGKNRLEESLDESVALVEIATILIFLWTSCITFILERTSFLKMAFHLTQIDQILDLRDASEARKQSINCISIVVVFVAILLGYTHYVWLAVSEIEVYAISYSAGYYLCYVVLVGLTVLYWVLSDGLHRRIVGLQNGLSFNKYNRNKRGEKLSSEYIMNMTFVYEHTFAALDAFSSAIGPTIFAAMINVVLTLVSSMYVMIVQSMRGIGFHLRFLEGCWALFHVARLIAIVEPAHRLNDGLISVRLLISELLSVDVDRNTKLQLDTFATHLLISPPGTFTPFGMINMTRGVLLTVTGTVTTYVVLLLNLKK